MSTRKLYLYEGVSIQFLGDHTDVFSITFIYPRLIATKFSPVIGFELKFVKM